MVRRWKFALGALVVCVVVLALSYLLPSDSRLGIMFFDRARPIYPFTVQNLMWVFFLVGLGELLARVESIRVNLGGLKSGYLITEPNILYGRDDIVDIRKRVFNKDDMLAHLLRMLTIRYQVSNWSVSETHSLLTSHMEQIQFQQEVDYSLVRFITWLLPTLGFIGTVMGISDALNYAGQPGVTEQDNFMSVLTSNLGFAFDTTLVALLMSAILVCLMHIIQSQEERTMQRCWAFCLENFINKLVTKA
jgi:biopolymer transport protein ExbB/TolQ